MKYCKRGHERIPENLNASRGCKICIKEQNRVRLLEGGEKIRERNRGYWSKNKEKHRERGRRYHAINREDISTRRRTQFAQSVEQLTDGYICKCMRLSLNNTPKELIELKRTHLTLKREIKNERNH
jgi:hypothetical protein